jgi:uncharacterized membrane protein YfcA
MATGTIIALAALILVVAFLYSSVGHAGASGYLAAMALMGLAPDVMKPTALALNILVATIGSIQFARAGHFSWRLFWPFAIASIPAAFLGGRIHIPAQYYKALIGAVLVFSAIRLAVGIPKSEPGTRPPPLPLAITTGALLGFFSGLTGTGGGIFLSPLILLCGWADPKKTAGVSAVFILVNSISGILGLFSAAGKLPPAVPLWAVAAVAGGLAGSYLGARRFSSPTLRRMLALVLVVAGLKLISALWSDVNSAGVKPSSPTPAPAGADLGPVRQRLPPPQGREARALPCPLPSRRDITPRA